MTLDCNHIEGRLLRLMRHGSVNRADREDERETRMIPPAHALLMSMIAKMNGTGTGSSAMTEIVTIVMALPTTMMTQGGNEQEATDITEGNDQGAVAEEGSRDVHVLRPRACSQMAMKRRTISTNAVRTLDV